MLWVKEALHIHTHTQTHTFFLAVCRSICKEGTYEHPKSSCRGKQYCGVDLSVSILVITVPLTPTYHNKQMVSCRDCDAKLVCLWPQFPLFFFFFFFFSVTPECLCFLQSRVLTLSYSVVLRYFSFNV